MGRVLDVIDEPFTHKIMNEKEEVVLALRETFKNTYYPDGFIARKA